MVEVLNDSFIGEQQGLDVRGLVRGNGNQRSDLRHLLFQSPFYDLDTPGVGSVLEGSQI